MILDIVSDSRHNLVMNSVEQPRISRKRSICDISATSNPKQIPSQKPIVRIVSARSVGGSSGNGNPVRPKDFLESLLRSLGLEVKVKSCLHLQDFFVEPKKSEIEAYGFESLNAVRNQDIDLLRKLHEEGRPLKCSNQFGESLLHLACRKSFAGVVRFLVKEVQVPFAVKDDFGRNPAHDACWTIKPNWELMDLIVEECPDLFFIEDVRGHTPLDYIRREHWPEWERYLRSKGLDLKPKCLPSTTTTVTATTGSSA